MTKFGGNTFIPFSIPLVFEGRYFLLEPGKMPLVSVFLVEGQTAVFEVLKNKPVENPFSDVVSTPPGIVTVTSKEGQFTVEMPAKPTINKSRVRKGVGGDVKTVLIGCRGEAGAYFAYKIILPTSIVKGTEDAELDEVGCGDGGDACLLQGIDPRGVDVEEGVGLHVLRRDAEDAELEQMRGEGGVGSEGEVSGELEVVDAAGAGDGSGFGGEESVDVDALAAEVRLHEAGEGGW